MLFSKHFLVSFHLSLTSQEGDWGGSHVLREVTLLVQGNTAGERPGQTWVFSVQPVPLGAFLAEGPTLQGDCAM